MPDANEKIKNDLTAIARLNNVINYDDKTSLMRACKIIEVRNPFASVYGKRFYERLQKMIYSDDYPHTCITCGKVIDSNLPMCKTCETALTNSMRRASGTGETSSGSKPEQNESMTEDSRNILATSPSVDEMATDDLSLLNENDVSDIASMVSAELSGTVKKDSSNNHKAQNVRNASRRSDNTARSQKQKKPQKKNIAKIVLPVCAAIVVLFVIAHIRGSYEVSKDVVQNQKQASADHIALAGQEPSNSQAQTPENSQISGTASVEQNTLKADFIHKDITTEEYISILLPYCKLLLGDEVVIQRSPELDDKTENSTLSHLGYDLLNSNSSVSIAKIKTGVDQNDHVKNVGVLSAIGNDFEGEQARVGLFKGVTSAVITSVICNVNLEEAWDFTKSVMGRTTTSIEDYEIDYYFITTENGKLMAFSIHDPTIIDDAGAEYSDNDKSNTYASAGGSSAGADNAYSSTGWGSTGESYGFAGESNTGSGDFYSVARGGSSGYPYSSAGANSEGAGGSYDPSGDGNTGSYYDSEIPVDGYSAPENESALQVHGKEQKRLKNPDELDRFVESLFPYGEGYSIEIWKDYLGDNTNSNVPRGLFTAEIGTTYDDFFKSISKDPTIDTNELYYQTGSDRCKCYVVLGGSDSDAYTERWTDLVVYVNPGLNAVASGVYKGKDLGNSVHPLVRFR